MHARCVRSQGVDSAAKITRPRFGCGSAVLWYDAPTSKTPGDAMADKLRFILFPIVLLLISFAGRLVMGARGVSYETANRVFSMVILQTHLALIWGALSKKYKGYGIGGAMLVGLLIGLTSQILILLGTV